MIDHMLNGMAKPMSVYNQLNPVLRPRFKRCQGQDLSQKAQSTSCSADKPPPPSSNSRCSLAQRRDKSRHRRAWSCIRVFASAPKHQLWRNHGAETGYKAPQDSRVTASITTQGKARWLSPERAGR